jgi:regulator of PEP synthase PpsR (kinase-PPPase family)
MPNRRTVFFLSDRTGITAEMLGNSLLSQFEDVAFRRITIPFVDSPEKVEEAIRLVNETSDAEERRRSCSARSSTRTRARSSARARRR